MFRAFFLSLFSLMLINLTVAQDISCQSHKSGAFATPPYYCAENLRSDTFNIFKYWIDLEIGNTTNKFIKGSTKIKFAAKQNNKTFIRFDLLKLVVDSIKEGTALLTYTYNDTILKINFLAPKNINDTAWISVYYHGLPQGDASGWGGFYFDNTGGAEYAYNLGVGFAANPHNYGRVWFPCFDNFVERSRYEFAIKSDTVRRAYCNGYLLSDVVTLPNRTRTWVMNDEIPTYLASVAVAKYSQVNWNVNTINGPRPITLAAVSGDTTAMKTAFVNLPNCITGFENYFGPYIWNRFGYCGVPFNSGAMEHATNISYPRATFGSLAYEAELMAHELSHHWWGDQITCETKEDMWINEGMASYSAFLFKEWQYGYPNYLTAIRSQHDVLLKQLHHKEGGFRAISGIPHNLTYGDHVYKKGSDVAHNLRTYLGDAAFFTALKYVLTQKTNQSINSAQMRDLMQISSGKNLSDFFNNWVFNGGWPHFAIDSVRIINQSAANCTVSIGVKQKLYGAPSLFNNVPLEVSFFKPDWSRSTQSFTYSGAAQQFTFALNFIPVSTILNYDSKIGDATGAETKTFKTVTSQNFSMARMRMIISNTGTDSNFVRLAHNFVKPDPFKSNPSNAVLSNQHYWKVDGIWSTGFVSKARFSYDGTNNYGSTYGYLDTLLTQVSGDSICVYYRKDAGDDWEMVKPYSHVQTSTKTGFVEIDTLKIGEYSFGKIGDTTSIGVKEYARDNNQISLYPNPAKRFVNVDLSQMKHFYNKLEVINAEGKEVYSALVSEKKIRLNTEQFAKGVYLVQIKDGAKLLVNKKLIIE